jgi:hypothetical protein
VEDARRIRVVAADSMNIKTTNEPLTKWAHMHAIRQAHAQPETELLPYMLKIIAFKEVLQAFEEVN